MQRINSIENITSLITYSNVKDFAECRRDKNRKRYYVISLLIIIITIMLVLLNHFIFQIPLDLKSVSLYMIPLIVFSYYNVFHRSIAYYKHIEKYLIIISLCVYIFLLMISEIWSESMIVTTALNVFTLINLVYILRTIIEVSHANLIGFTLEKLNKDVRNLSYNVNKNEGEIDYYFFNEVYDILIDLVYWYKITPKQYLSKDFRKYLNAISKIEEYIYDLETYNRVFDSKIVITLDNELMKFENAFIAHAYLRNRTNDLEYVSSYYADKLQYLLKQGKHEYFENTKNNLVYHVLEFIIQRKNDLAFGQMVGTIVGLGKYCKENELNDKEHIDSLLSLHYSLINVIKKYLDNVSTIAGKFILQELTLNYDFYKDVSETSKNINYHIFDLIKTLKEKENDGSTMIIFYYFLRDIIKKINSLNQKKEFYHNIIIALKDHEREISQLVFNDISNLIESDVYSKEDLIDFYVDIHLLFSDDIINRNVQLLEDFILSDNFYVKDQNEVISHVGTLMRKHTVFGKYFFDSLSKKIIAGQLTSSAFLIKRQRLFELQKEILIKFTSYEEVNKVIFSFIRLNTVIIENATNKNNKEDRKLFYEDAISVLQKLYDHSFETSAKTDAIKTIEYLASENMYNDNFKSAINAFKEIGLDAIQENDSAIQRKLSNSLGWTINKAIANSNIQEATIKKAFGVLIHYYKLVCKFSSIDTKQFVGTAIVINYVKYHLKSNSYSNAIENYIKELIADNHFNSREILKDSLLMKEETIDRYFNDSEKKNADLHLRHLEDLLHTI